MSTSPEPDHAHGKKQKHGHRFLILGKEKLFFYHLGLYNPQSGHQYQAVFSFTIKDNGELKKKYLDLLGQNENKRVFFSLFTPMFPLPDLRNGMEFPVELEQVVVLPNGERDFQDMKLRAMVQCKKEDVLSFRKLGDLAYPDYLTYLVFGEGDEIHLAHQLAKHPNWDEVITVTTTKPIDPATLKKVPTLVIDSIKDEHEDNGKRTESPLEKGRKYQGKLNGNGNGPTVDFTVGRQGWWNHTSLNKMPPH